MIVLLFDPRCQHQCGFDSTVPLIFELLLHQISLHSNLVRRCHSG
nr:MAG TPA: hypothetical protein [Bacteriophage sp.]